MKPRTLAIIALIVVVVVGGFFMTRFFVHDAQRADRATGADKPPATEAPFFSDETEKATPNVPPATTKEPVLDDPSTTLDSEPTSSSTPFTAPKADLGKAKLSKKYRSIFGGKLSIRVPNTWCQTGKQPEVEVFFVDKGSCGAKNANHAIIIFSDLTTTSSSDLFLEWAENPCGEGGGGTFEDPVKMMLGGEPAEFYRSTCVDGSSGYAWLILSRDKLVTVENPTQVELRRAQAVLEQVRWG